MAFAAAEKQRSIALAINPLRIVWLANIVDISCVVERLYKILLAKSLNPFQAEETSVFESGMMFESHDLLGDDMSQMVAIKLEVPDDLARFRLPPGVNTRLQELLDRQDSGERLTPAERKEAQGLVNLAELLSLLRLRVGRVTNRRVKK